MKDVAMLLDIMTGQDHYDNLTFQAIRRCPQDGYAAKTASKDALRGLKLGLPFNPYWSSNGVSHELCVLFSSKGLDFPLGSVLRILFFLSISIGGTKGSVILMGRCIGHRIKFDGR
jgi:hypothetical protein